MTTVIAERPTETRDYWRCELPDDGHPVLFCRTLGQLDQILANLGYDYEIPSTGGRQMLVLSRKAGESIILEVDGVEVEVIVSRIKRTTVSIGIMAPQDFHIRRKELKKEGTNGTSCS